MAQKTMVHLHSGILCSRKKGALSLCNSMDGTEEHFAKWNKPGDERQIPYDLTFNRKLINKTNKQNITKDTEIENRLIVIRGEGGGNFRGRGWKVCRNNYKGHMDNNGVGWKRAGRGGKGRKLEKNYTLYYILISACNNICVILEIKFADVKIQIPN